MKNSLKIIATSALLLTASSAMAGLLSSPMGIIYSNPELAPVNAQRLDESIIRVHSTGLTGELTISKVNASGNDESPPSWDTDTTEKVVLPFEQELQFDIDYADGTVSGRSTANIYDQSSPLLVVTAEVRGKATCLPLNGLECGQLVVDLELQGVVSDPNDPGIVGKLEMNMLGSVYADGSDIIFANAAHWAAMSANTTISMAQGLTDVYYYNLIDALAGINTGVEPLSP